MAAFEDARARKTREQEDSFLDWEGEATLFRHDPEEDEEDEDADDEAEVEEADGPIVSRVAAAIEEEDEDEEEPYDDEEELVEELDFG